MASGKPGFVAGQFASNGYDALSPGDYAMTSAIIMEIVCTFVSDGDISVRRISGRQSVLPACDWSCPDADPSDHIPIDNTSVNPARSTGPAIFAGAAEISQLWLFWLVPLIGGGIAGLVYPVLFGEEVSEQPIVGKAVPAGK